MIVLHILATALFFLFVFAGVIDMLSGSYFSERFKNRNKK